MAALRRAKPPRLAPIGYFDRLAEDVAVRAAAGRATAPAAPAPASREDAATAVLRAECAAMWRRFIDVEQSNGPCPPSMGRWLAGDVEDADQWRAYAIQGRSVFLRAA